jgi:tetratricopeptide (TPR) repeat protein
LHALAPAAARGDRAETVDRLHSLLECIDLSLKKEERTEQGAEEEEEKRAWVLLLRRRQREIVFALVSLHATEKRYPAALRLLDRLLAENEYDVEAWCHAARLQVLAGDAEASEESAARAARAAARSGDKFAIAEAKTTAALALFSEQAYQPAADAFSAAAADALAAVGDAAGGEAYAAGGEAYAVAAANSAVASLYAGRFDAAVAKIESAFTEHPAIMLSEASVRNTASVYELGGAPRDAAAKREMVSWVAAAAPDDFDPACCKA